MTRVFPPKHVYKYRCVDANALAMLATDRLYAARIESFNDPFEFQSPSIVHAAGQTTNPSEAFEALDRAARQTPHHSSLRMCALTEVRDDLLMWGHYADCHRGFCLQFEPEAHQWFRERLFAVVYDDKLPSMGRPPTEAEEILQYAALTKSDHWKYEREWRLIAHVAEDRAHTGEMYISYAPSALTGVIFGIRTPDPHKALIRKLLQDHKGVRYYQANKSHEAFALTIREIEPPSQ